MSTQGIRDFRPKLHFSPKTMWMNDPNGLIYINGTYHLFYQYHPYSTEWGPMHWGHATSTDLVTWSDLPIALYPDDLGYIFSGSAVYDRHNTSGLGTTDTPPIVAIFTHDGAHQQQSIAYSTDGIVFHKYTNNPVISNTQYRDFRDPKVFWNTTLSCWSMVLAAGDKVIFYQSSDLKTWEKTGEFGSEYSYIHGVWECPDLFPLSVNHTQKWVLLVSMGMSDEDRGPRTQYFIGEFDGNTFKSDDGFKQAAFLDEGFDHYAGVTFSNTSDSILIGWGISGKYAYQTPTNEFCGIMTLPRLLSLIETPHDGIRLCSNPIHLDNYFTPFVSCPASFPISHETFRLKICGNSACQIHFSNDSNQYLDFGITKDNHVFIDRSHAGATSFNELFSSELYSVLSTKRFFDDVYEIEVIFDVSSLEVFIDKGSLNFSQVVYPDSPYNRMTIQGNVSVSYSYMSQN